MKLKELARSGMSADWFAALSAEFDADYMSKLEEFLNADAINYRILPPAADIFNAFRLTPLYAVKAVILGQDPYPNPLYGHGLCFSVREGVSPYPMSLRNIFKELHADLGITAESGCLERWASEGVLLLNSSLTVREGQPMSHAEKGWQAFTDRVIELVSEKCDSVAFVLLGNFARSRKPLIDKSKHLVIEAAHPSPLSAGRGFFGSRPFGKVNGFLASRNLSEIDFTPGSLSARNIISDEQSAY